MTYFEPGRQTTCARFKSRIGVKTQAATYKRLCDDRWYMTDDEWRSISPYVRPIAVTITFRHNLLVKKLIADSHGHQFWFLPSWAVAQCGKMPDSFPRTGIVCWSAMSCVSLHLYQPCLCNTSEHNKMKHNIIQHNTMQNNSIQQNTMQHNIIQQIKTHYYIT